MKKVYKFYCDCGRMGELDGIFIAEEEDVKNAIGKEVYFGEVLGKHSEIGGELESSEITVCCENPEAVAIIETIADGNGTISGFNPLNYLCEEEEV